MAQKYKYKVEGGCQLCLMCVMQCPVKAISIIENVSVKIDETKCVGCGRCYNACQPGAIERYALQECKKHPNVKDSENKTKGKFLK